MSHAPFQPFDQAHLAPVDTLCEVRSVDMVRRVFEGVLPDGEKVTGSFPENLDFYFESAPSLAPRKRLRIWGDGVYEDGHLVRISKVDNIRSVCGDGTVGKSMETILEETWGKLSDEELAEIPQDLAINLDHYLYGFEKESP